MKIQLILTLAVLVSAGATSAHANTIENLERERSVAIELIMSPDLTPEQRFEELSVTQRRLADLERAVLYDKSLGKRSNAQVKRALENFELTFLVHAAAEKNKALSAHWLDSVGLTASEIQTTRVSR